METYMRPLSTAFLKPWGTIRFKRLCNLIEMNSEIWKLKKGNAIVLGFQPEIIQNQSWGYFWYAFSELYCSDVHKLESRSLHYPLLCIEIWWLKGESYCLALRGNSWDALCNLSRMGISSIILVLPGNSLYLVLPGNSLDY